MVETVDLEITCRSYLDSPPGSKSPHSPIRNYRLKSLSQFPRSPLSPSGHLWSGSPERETQYTSLEAQKASESQAKKTPFKRFHSIISGDHTWAPRGNKQAPHTPPPETLAPSTANQSLPSYSSTLSQSARPRNKTNASCCPVPSTVLAKDSYAEPPEHRGGGCPPRQSRTNFSFLRLGCPLRVPTSWPGSQSPTLLSESLTLLLAPRRSDL